VSKTIEEKIAKIPVINLRAALFKKVKLPGMEGLSLYDLLEMYIVGIAQGALSARASAIAFSFFTALFPFLLFILIVIPYIPVEGFEKDFMLFLESVLPPNTSDFFIDNIFENINTQKGGLISSVFALSIFLMANGVNAVFSGFENSYHKLLTRNIVRQYIFALLVALILAFLLILVVAVPIYFEIYVIENLEDMGTITKDEGVSGLVFAKYIFFVMVIYLATATLYYFGTKEGRQSKFFSIGALFTTFLIILTSYLFGLYIENFSQYNELYGSIGALLILMFYLWLNANIILLGFELNASLHQLRRKLS